MCVLIFLYISSKKHFAIQEFHIKQLALLSDLIRIEFSGHILE
jgi:hypothetical protein